MNILSISQLQTQNSQIDFQQNTGRIDTEKSSFADFLRDARKSTENENPAAESEKVAKNDTFDSNKIDEKKAEKEPVEKEKSEKLTQKKSSDDEKSEKNLENLEKSTESSEKLAVQNLNQFQNSKNLQIDEKTLSDFAENLSVAETGNVEGVNIDDKMLAWLVSSSRNVEEGEEISSDDFAKLIDAAVEFIPGAASDEEKLESAQTLAANDPQKFLETIADAGALEASRGAQKSELTPDDRKVASKDIDKKTGAKLSVHDLRTRHLFDEADAKIASDKVVQKSAEKKEINLSMQKQADGALQMTMELANRAQENISSSSSQAAGATGSDFQAMLSNAVQDNAPEFVKAGNIVLKDNNQGSINLILRPEGLGNVKISLNLDDKNLSAQITVQTKEAMDAFRESIPSLKQAFTESGFETGSFDLNFSNNQSNQQGFAQGENQNQQLFAQKSYGEFVTPRSLASEAAADSYSETDYGINIVA